MAGWPGLLARSLRVPTSNVGGAPSFAAFAKGGNRHLHHETFTPPERANESSPSLPAPHPLLRIVEPGH